MTTTETPQTTSSAAWIHAENPDEKEIALLCNTYGLTERFVRDALDRDEIPRVETVGDYTYVITRFAYSSGKDIETAPLLFALNHGRLITVSLERLPSLDDILPDGSQPEGQRDPVLLMLRILLYNDAQYDRFIHDASREIHTLLRGVGKRDLGPSNFIRFVHIEDDMNDFLSSLSPTNATLRHLLTDKTVPAFSQHHELVNTVILNNEQSIQVCEANLKSLDSVRRTYTLIGSHHLDRTIKILTLASVFISIPTMFFSMYGMNIALPWMHNKQTFVALVVICLLVTWSAYTIGRKKRIF